MTSHLTPWVSNCATTVGVEKAMFSDRDRTGTCFAVFSATGLLTPVLSWKVQAQCLTKDLCDRHPLWQEMVSLSVFRTGVWRGALRQDCLPVELAVCSSQAYLCHHQASYRLNTVSGDIFSCFQNVGRCLQLSYS